MVLAHKAFKTGLSQRYHNRIDTIKCKELWQPSLLSITFPIGDTELDFDMVAVFPGEKKTTNNCPEITLKGYDKILFEYNNKLYYFYAGEYLVYSQEHFYCYGRKEYEALH